MRGVAASAALAWSALAVLPACADDIPSCAVPRGVVTSTSLENAPPLLQQALKAHIGEVVPPGGKFDSTDVVRVGRDRRLIFIWNAGRRWVVATEHGGRGYNDPIFAYDLDQDRQRLAAERVAVPGTVCATARELLSTP